MGLAGHKRLSIINSQQVGDASLLKFLLMPILYFGVVNVCIFLFCFFFLFFCHLPVILLFEILPLQDSSEANLVMLFNFLESLILLSFLFKVEAHLLSVFLILFLLSLDLTVVSQYVLHILPFDFKNVRLDIGKVHLEKVKILGNKFIVELLLFSKLIVFIFSICDLIKQCKIRVNAFQITKIFRKISRAKQCIESNAVNLYYLYSLKKETIGGIESKCNLKSFSETFHDGGLFTELSELLHHVQLLFNISVVIFEFYSLVLGKVPFLVFSSRNILNLSKFFPVSSFQDLRPARIESGCEFGPLNFYVSVFISNLLIFKINFYC